MENAISIPISIPLGWLVLRGATEYAEYEEPPFALLAEEVVGATEYEEPPFALLAAAQVPRGRLASNNAKSGTWRFWLGRELL